MTFEPASVYVTAEEFVGMLGAALAAGEYKGKHHPEDIGHAVVFAAETLTAGLTYLIDSRREVDRQRR